MYDNLLRYSVTSVTGLIQDLMVLARTNLTVCSFTSNVRGGWHRTLVSYRCSLGFTVYRLHCGFLELFLYNVLGQVCPCTSRQTLGLHPRVCLWKIPRLQTLPRAKFFQTTPRLFNSLSDFGFLEVQGQTCLNALYGKTSRKLQ